MSLPPAAGTSSLLSSSLEAGACVGSTLGVALEIGLVSGCGLGASASLSSNEPAKGLSEIESVSLGC